MGNGETTRFCPGTGKVKSEAGETDCLFNANGETKCSHVRVPLKEVTEYDEYELLLVSL